MSATIVVNGEERGLDVATVTDLLKAERLDLERPGIAVARNGAVVPRADWSRTALEPGDLIEIVKPFSGG